MHAYPVDMWRILLGFTSIRKEDQVSLDYFMLLAFSSKSSMETFLQHDSRKPLLLISKNFQHTLRWFCSISYNSLLMPHFHCALNQRL